MIRRALYYLGVLPAVLGLAAVLGMFHQKLRANMSARRGVWRRFAEAMRTRDRDTPLVWFHVASAGEFLQAEPILRRFRGQRVQLVITVTSVSGLGWTKRVSDWPEVIWADVLPWDFPWNVRRLLRDLRPAAIVYLQADLWPVLTWEAHRRGIPQVLLAARLNEGSLKSWLPVLHGMYRKIYSRLSVILAASRKDAERLRIMAPDHVHLEFGGDPGIESVLSRVQESPLPPLPESFTAGDAPVLVLGSSWPADERQVFPVVQEVMRTMEGLRLVIAPHEPLDSRLMALEAAFGEQGTIRLSELERVGSMEVPDASPAKEARVILLDSVGRLASLYRMGTVAYVGGGFGAGVHNVAEPAAAGLPVVFGPRYSKSAAAQQLLDEGAGFCVMNELAVRHTLLPLLSNVTHCQEVGRKGRASVEGMSGAAQRCYAAILAVAPALGAN